MDTNQRIMRLITQEPSNSPKYPAAYEEFRDAFQIDYDRVLHSSYLRRLAGVTQVVNPAEGHIFHNRLTHTMKVVQIARRLAQYLIFKYKSNTSSDHDPFASLGGLNENVVEAAALVHDLGHPPFGHIAEKHLDRLVSQFDLDGYEGNAQSFRIVTKIAVRREREIGLNLTKAVLNAILKYPWTQTGSGNPRENKWGVYESEKEMFDRVREMYPGLGRRRTLEAEVMDWADDITYAIHDLEDFYKAGLIPIPILKSSGAERDRFVKDCLDYLWKEIDSAKAPKFEFTTKEELEAEIKCKLDDLLELFEREPFDHSRAYTTHLTSKLSGLIKELIIAMKLQEEGSRFVDIDTSARLKVHILQYLTRYYVIYNPSLASQQHGQKKIIETLFDYYCDIIQDRDEKVLRRLPHFYRALLEEEQKTSINVNIRVAADIVSNMTDNEAINMYKRITGQNLGSLFDRQ